MALADYFTVANAIFRTGPDPVPGQATVEVDWTGTGQRTHIDDPDGAFAGAFESAEAAIR